MSNSDIAAIHAAEDTLKSINDWMKDHPVIETEEDAREAKPLLDRGSLAISDMGDERRKKTDPMMEKVEAVRAQYRGPTAALDAIVRELGERLGSFIKREQAKREEEARKAREAAAELERKAREAEALEKSKLEDAAAGELDVDVAQVTQQADEAFSEYKAAERAAALAEREAKVKIGGGFRRAIGLKKKETLVIVDVIEFLEDYGSIPEEVEEAVLKCARVYRRVNKRLPKGIEAREE